MSSCDEKAVSKVSYNLGSGCDSVGRAAASNTRGLQFEHSHSQKFLMNKLIVEKTKAKQKRPGMTH